MKYITQSDQFYNMTKFMSVTNFNFLKEVPIFSHSRVLGIVFPKMND